MEFQLFIQNSPDGQIFEIQDVVCETTVTQNIDGTAGKLTTVFEKDPNQILGLKQETLSNGSWIWMRVNGTPFFYGRIFTIGTSIDGSYKITAYDGLRYLKNSDILAYRGMKASDIFADICKNLNVPYNIKAPTDYVPPQYNNANGGSLYSIIKRGMDLASINDGRRYFIVDNFGTLTWSSFDIEKTDIQLGDESLISDYTYEKTIDNDVYNKIKLYRSNDETGKIDTWTVEDTNNQIKWGVLQLLQQVDDKVNASQIRTTAENLLKVKNRENETLRLKCDGILELTSGKGVKVVMKELGINEWLWITSSSHRFTKFDHTMDLEVELDYGRFR